MDDRPLDDLDRKVLSLLAQDPRQTLKELSAALRDSGRPISHEAVRNRIHRLLGGGGVLPLLDWRALGLDLVIVTLHLDGPAHVKATRKRCEDAGAVLTLAQFGDADFQAWFLVRSQTQLAAVLSDLRNARGVRDAAFAVVTESTLHAANLARDVGAPPRRRRTEG
ncbi:MAG: winged helix-turn-helix transcriptional regulator [Halobacteriales archaeon]|nr:winged helix-turn-helix transcriptional regulator [Halobacteriales archaeon]